MTRIERILPHRPPFLFVDTIREFVAGASIVAAKYVSAEADFFKGHFPGKPVMPGVLVAEALAQTSGLLIGLTLQEQEPHGRHPLTGFVLTSIDIKFLEPVTPGVTLLMTSVLQKKFGNLYRFGVVGAVAEKVVAKGILSLGHHGTIST